MEWTLLDPKLIDASKFGLIKIHACKVSKWSGKSDIRRFQLSGWITYAELTDIDQVYHEKLQQSKWYIYAAKGE